MPIRTSGATTPVRSSAACDDCLPPRSGAAIVLAAVVAVVVVMLGPALLGLQTLTAMDLLARLAPWSDGVALDPVVNPWLSDSIDFYLPHYIELRERIWAGDLPLTSTLAGSGAELLANPNTPVLGPTTAWYVLLPTVYAAGVVKLAEVVVAVGGMALWLRRIGLAWPPALFAGLLYVGSGFFASWGAWSAQSGVAALLPALFWVLERQLALRSAKAAVSVAVVVALILLAGFPAVAGHGLYLAAGYVLVRLLAAPTPLRTRLSSLGATGAAVLLGMALSAAQTIPLVRGLQFVDLANRADLFSTQLPLASLVTALYPRTDDNLAFWGTDPIEGYAYVGVGALALTVFALVSRRTPSEVSGVVPCLAGAAAIAASLVWTQGWWNDWLGAVPVFEGNRSPRLRAVLFLCLTALAGIGAHRLFCAPLLPRHRRQMVVVATVSAAVLLATALAVRGPLSSEGARADVVQDLFLGLGLCAVLAAVAVRYGQRSRLVGFIALNVLVAVQVTVSVASFWPSSDTRMFYPELPIIAAAKASAGEGRLVTPNTFMGSSGSAYGLRTLTGHAFQAPSWSDVIQRIAPSAYVGSAERPASPTNPNLPVEVVGSREQMALLDRMSATAVVAPPMVTLPGRVAPLERIDRIASVGSSAAYRDILTGDLPRLTMRGVRLHISAPVPARVTGTTLIVEARSDEGDVIGTGRLRQVLFQPGAVDIPFSREVDGSDTSLSLTLRADASLALSSTPSGAPDVAVISSAPDGVKLVYADEHGSVWSRLTGLSRFRWARQAEVLLHDKDRLARLEAPSLSDDVVVLSRPGDLGDGRSARVRVLEDKGDRLSVQVTAEGSGYLVVGDAVQTGWEAQVDGEPAELVEADHALGAVHVHEGTHVVDLVYVGNGLRAGALTSAAALLMTGALLVVARARKPDRRKEMPRPDPPST